MNDDQITSGPYEVEIHENGCVFITSDYASHGDICDFYHKTDDGEIVTKHNAIANAKFVGRAMNSHEALVEALEELLGLDDIREASGLIVHRMPAHVRKKVWAALKLARGDQ